ncbi:MAG: Mut7-C RNAse domain-containing protein [Conexivisphaera sp.]
MQGGAGGAGAAVGGRLIVDGMLGDLARKLRLLGVDVEYLGGVSDDVLLRLAAETSRTLVSVDASLCSSARARGLEVICTSDLASVLASMGIRRVEFDPRRARCPHCNTPVTVVDAETVRGEVPAGVLESHEEFYACFGCGRIYWVGGHWENIKKLELELNRSLGNEPRGLQPG